MNLHLTPIDLRPANAYVAAFHRHHKPSRGHKFSIAVIDDAETLRGVAIASKPRNRVLMSRGYLEVVRVCTDGTPNVCSMLYGAMRRAGTAMGYLPQRIITYTLASEPGTSLRAAGWVLDGEVDGRSWDTPGRPREDQAPTDDKLRWRAAA